MTTPSSGRQGGPSYDWSSLPNVVTGETADIAAMAYQEIMPKLHGLQPGQYTAAADAFRELSDVLETVRSKIAATGDAMAANGSWKGSAAQSAMQRFQQLHDQAASLSVQAKQAGDTINWFGAEATPPFQQIPNPQVMGKSEADAIMSAPIDLVMPGGGSAGGAVLGAMGIGPDGQGKADKAAREYMTAYNQQIVKMNNALPGATSSGYMHQNQPWSTPPPNPGAGGGGGGAGSGTGSGYAGVPGTTGTGTGGTIPGYTPHGSGNPFAASHLPSGGAGPTASLQGYTPPPSGTTTSPFGAGSPGPAPAGSGTGSPFSMMPGGSGFGAGAAGEGLAGGSGLGKGGPGKGGLPSEEGVPGEGGAAGAEGSAAGAAEGRAAAGEAAGAEGASGMPMGGMGGGGQQDKERQREAWMHEDESIWGVPDTEIGSEIG